MDPHYLRTLYQENSSLFLLSCSNATPKQLVGSVNKSNFTHVESAKSLILNSIYNHYPNNHVTPDHRACIISSSDSDLLKRGNNNLKGSIATISSDDDKQIELNALEQKFEELRKCASDMISIDKKAEICSNFMDQQILETQRKKVRSEFYCIACGLPYFNNGGNYDLSSKIKLKMLKRGKTRRRRASRYTAAKFIFDNDILQKHRGGGKSFSKANSISSTNISHGGAVASIMDTRVTLRNVQATRRTNDGMSKHCLSYKCSCGYEQLYKGCRRRRNYNSDERTGKNISTNNKTQATKVHDMKLKRKYPEKNIQGNNINVESNEDFISLAPVAKTAHHNLLNAGKKRRPKTKQGDKSKLQDFLSSLND